MPNALTNWIGRTFGTAAPLPAAEQRSVELGGIPITAATLAAFTNGGPTRSGVQINEHTALTYSAVFAAVLVLSEAVAQLPLGVFEGDDQIEDRTPASDNPVHALLRHAPNGEMTPFVFKETLQASLCLWGNAYARIVFGNDGVPAQLWPMRPDQTVAERVAGQLQYRDLRTGDRFAAEEVLHIPGLSLNGITGLDPISLHREAISLGKAAELFGASFYGNGANMGGIMAYDGQLKPETQDAARLEWLKMQTGLANASRTAFLGKGWTYTPIGIPPDNAQFLQTRQFQIQDIARIFRVPPHMLGDLSSDGYATIEQQSLNFLLFTLTPWLEKWEQELKRKLLPAGQGLFVKFDERRMQRADLAAKQAWYQAGINTGWYSVNDVRREEGQPSIGPQGDVYRFPVNYVDAKNAAKIGTPGGGGPTPAAGVPVPPEFRSVVAAAVAITAARAVRDGDNPTAAAAKSVAGLPPYVDEHARDDLAEIVTGSLRRGRDSVDALRVDILNHFESRP